MLWFCRVVRAGCGYESHNCDLTRGSMRKALLRHRAKDANQLAPIAKPQMGSLRELACGFVAPATERYADLVHRFQIAGLARGARNRNDNSSLKLWDTAGCAYIVSFGRDNQ